MSFRKRAVEGDRELEESGGRIDMGESIGVKVEPLAVEKVKGLTSRGGGDGGRRSIGREATSKQPRVGSV